MISKLLRPYRLWCETQSITAELRQIIEHERRLLDDPDYLLSDVIGKGEFDWDFRCLDHGFLALVNPYFAQQSGTLPLFLSVLRELKADTNQNKRACLFVEFGHYATLINDYYTFHPNLSAASIDRRQVSRLTQLRYAGQYLSMYPRYLLVSDYFCLSNEQQIDLHEALAGSVVVQGASRGVILKWSGSQKHPGSQEQYLQNCINTIHSYVVFPVLLASILSGVDRQSSGALRAALGHLALAMKLAIERESLMRGGSLDVSDAAQSTATILSRQGLPGAAYEEIIEESLDTFKRKLRDLGLLAQWGKSLALALAEESGG